MTREPEWCVKTDHDDSAIGMHVSERRHVGDRFNGRGEVGLHLSRGGDGPTWLAVNCAHGTSCTVDVSLDEAEELFRQGLDLVRRAREAEGC